MIGRTLHWRRYITPIVVLARSANAASAATLRVGQNNGSGIDAATSFPSG